MKLSAQMEAALEAAEDPRRACLVAGEWLPIEPPESELRRRNSERERIRLVEEVYLWRFKAPKNMTFMDSHLVRIMEEFRVPWRWRFRAVDARQADAEPKPQSLLEIALLFLAASWNGFHARLAR